MNHKKRIFRIEPSPSPTKHARNRSTASRLRRVSHPQIDPFAGFLPVLLRTRSRQHPPSVRGHFDLELTSPAEARRNQFGLKALRLSLSPRPEAVKVRPKFRTRFVLPKKMFQAILTGAVSKGLVQVRCPAALKIYAIRARRVLIRGAVGSFSGYAPDLEAASLAAVLLAAFTAYHLPQKALHHMTVRSRDRKVPA